MSTLAGRGFEEDAVADDNEEAALASNRLAVGVGNLIFALLIGSAVASIKCLTGCCCGDAAATAVADVGSLLCAMNLTVGAGACCNRLSMLRSSQFICLTSVWCAVDDATRAIYPFSKLLMGRFPCQSQRMLRGTPRVVNDLHGKSLGDIRV